MTASAVRPLELGWFLPTRGDTDDYGTPLKISASAAKFERVTVAAEEAGFFFQGLGPSFAADGDALLLQYLPAPLDLDALQLYGDEAKALLAYVAAERARVGGVT